MSNAILATWGIKSTFTGLVVTVWDLETSFWSSIQVGNPTLSTMPLGSYVWTPTLFPWSPKFSLVSYSNYILPLAFEGRWGCTGIISLSASSPQKTNKTSVALSCFFSKSMCRFRLFILLSSDLVKDLLLLERHPSSLISLEFKCSLHAF